MSSRKQDILIIRVPRGVWEMLSETLALDAKSKAFDPALRRSVRKAMRQVREAGEPYVLVGLYGGIPSKVKVYWSHLKEGIPQGRIELEYSYLRTWVTDSKNVATYTHQVIDGVYLVETIEDCSDCGSINKRLDYSPRLDLVGVTSIDGETEITTAYVYDDPKTAWEQVGEIVERTEALGWDEERTIGCSYTFDEENLLLVREKIETRESVLSPEGEKTTTWVYDEAGNLISREETGYVLIDGVPILRTITDEGSIPSPLTPST